MVAVKMVAVKTVIVKINAGRNAKQSGSGDSPRIIS